MRHQTSSTSAFRLSALAGSLTVWIGILASGAPGASTASTPDSKALEATHLGLPPETRPTSFNDAALAELGSRLFKDKSLSATGSISCATCHIPGMAFTDGRSLAVGNNGQVTTRNTPTLLNVGFEKALFWDGREKELETQAIAPLLNPIEHGLTNSQAVVDIIRRSPTYVREFELVLGRRPSDLTIDDIGLALAAFERTLIAGGSRFDLFYYGRRPDALSDSARRGLALFQGRAQCASCHVIEEKFATFSDGTFHASERLPASANSNLASLTKRMAALSDNPAARESLISRESDVAALGRYLATLDPVDIGKFKTPSLRNVALTAPYMHDGSVPTLRDAIDRELYTRTSAGNYPIALTLGERADLLEFLESLTSPAAIRRVHRHPDSQID